MNTHEKLNYVEIPTIDIVVTKSFFIDVFNWQFQDFGEEYSAFSNSGIDGGFYKSDKTSTTANGSVLLVFYSKELEKIATKIEQAGGKITKSTFTFPGGSRFHFIEPSGNEFAVWSDISL